MKQRLWWAVCSVALATVGCESSSPSNAEISVAGTYEVQSLGDVPPVPDLGKFPDLDPLKVTQDHVGLVSFMSQDSLDQVAGDMYTYFHSSNVGDWDNNFKHFPNHRNQDTAMLATMREMMEKWFHQGLRNRAGAAHIRYASPWVVEDDQRVALLGMDLTYYLDFFEHFEGNPEGMRFSLERTWGAETVTWNEFDQVEQGDSMHIRQFEVNAETSMFVLAPKSDSMLFTFLPPTIQSSPALAADMMNNETMLTLLRHKREHFDKQ